MARKIIPLYFNTEKDADLLAYLSGYNVSQWVKKRLRAELYSNRPPERQDITPEMVALIECIIEKKITGRVITPLSNDGNSLEFEVLNDVLGCL